MPCNTRQTSVIQWNANTDVVLLQLALQAEGFSAVKVEDGLRFEAGYTRGWFRDGTMRIEGVIDENSLKRAYSAQVVKSAAKRFGWAVQQRSAQEFQVTRR